MTQKKKIHQVPYHCSIYEIHINRLTTPQAAVNTTKTTVVQSVSSLTKCENWTKVKEQNETIYKQNIALLWTYIWIMHSSIQYKAIDCSGVFIYIETVIGIKSQHDSSHIKDICMWQIDSSRYSLRSQRCVFGHWSSPRGLRPSAASSLPTCPFVLRRWTHSVRAPLYHKICL